MSKSWDGGSTRAWRRTRALVLQRDSYTCQVRLPGCTIRATHAHHLDGKASGDDLARIVASCAHCNLSVGEPTGNPTPTPRTRW